MRTPEPPPRSPVAPNAAPGSTHDDALDLQRRRVTGLNAAPSAPAPAPAPVGATMTSSAVAVKHERAAVAKELTAMRRYVKEMERELEALALERERSGNLVKDADARVKAIEEEASTRVMARELELDRLARDLAIREEALEAKSLLLARADAQEARNEKFAGVIRERERALEALREELASKDDALTDAIIALERESDVVRRDAAALERRRGDIADELSAREVSVLKREDAVTTREHEIRMVENRLTALRARVEEEESRATRAMERADTTESRSSDAEERLRALESDERRALLRVREAQSELERTMDAKSSAERETESIKKSIEVLRREVEAFESEKTRIQGVVEDIREELNERERETASAAEIAAKECESIAVAWEEIEAMRRDLERQEKMIEETAVQLEENVKAFDRDATSVREKQDALEYRSKELDEQESFLTRIARENENREVALRNAEADAEALALDLSTRRKALETRESEVSGWKAKFDEATAKEADVLAKIADIESREAKIRESEKEIEELSSRERELEAKEAQLEQREEAVARQLSAAAEAEVLLNEEHAKLDDKMQSAAPVLLASALEEEIFALKAEVEHAKARANAATATAELERRRAEEAEAHGTNTLGSPSTSHNAEVVKALERALELERVKYESAIREMSELKERSVGDERVRAIEDEFAAKTSALLRANALLDSRESELIERETAISEEMDRVERDTERLERLHAELNDRMEHAMGQRHTSDDREAISEELKRARVNRLEAEQLRQTARAHLEAAAATVEATKAINVEFEVSERQNVQMMKRVSSVVTAALAAAQQEGDQLRAQRQAMDSQRQKHDVSRRDVSRDDKADMLEAQLEYVSRAKSELDRREAALRSMEFATSSHKRTTMAIENSFSNMAARSDAHRLRDDVRRAASRLREYLSQGESRLARAQEVLPPAEVATLRLKLAGLVGVAQKLANEDGRVDSDERLAERLKSLEHEIRRTGGWFEDLRAVVRAAK